MEALQNEAPGAVPHKPVVRKTQHKVYYFKLMPFIRASNICTQIAERCISMNSTNLHCIYKGRAKTHPGFLKPAGLSSPVRVWRLHEPLHGGTRGPTGLASTSLPRGLMSPTCLILYEMHKITYNAYIQTKQNFFVQINCPNHILINYTFILRSCERVPSRIG